MAGDLVDFLKDVSESRNGPIASYLRPEKSEAGSLHGAMNVIQRLTNTRGLAAHGTVGRRAWRLQGALPAHRESSDAGFVRGKKIAANIGAATGLPSDLKVHARRAGFATGTREKRGDHEEPS